MLGRRLLINQVRSTQYLRSKKDQKLPLVQRLRELAQVRLRWGYRRLHVLQARRLQDRRQSNLALVPAGGVAVEFLAQDTAQDSGHATSTHAAALRQ